MTKPTIRELLAELHAWCEVPTEVCEAPTEVEVLAERVEAVLKECEDLLEEDPVRRSVARDILVILNGEQP